MRTSGAITVVELDGDRLLAVNAVVSERGVSVGAGVVRTRPESIENEDIESIGGWMRGEMQAAGIGRGRIIMSLPRGDVVLKRLILPLVRESRHDDTPGMVRLQMIRQLTMVSEGTVIDFVPLSGVGENDDGQPGDAAVQEVFAGALPAERLSHYVKLADAAGFKMRRIALRCFGLGAILADLSQRRDGPVLGISLGRGATEFVIVENGQVTLARAADMPRPEEPTDIDLYAERVAVEAKRTLASFRAGRTGSEPVLTAIVGERTAAERVAQSCAKAMEAPVQCVESPATVEFSADIRASERSELAPLIGLLLAESRSIPMLDFAAPRRAADPAQRRRTALLAGALGMLVIAGAGFIVAHERLGAIEIEVKMAETARAELEDEHLRYLRTHARLSHLQRWSDARIDWISHLKLLNEQMPDTSKAVLDSLAGTMKAAVTYTPSGRDYLDGAWNLRESAEFALSGRVRERDAATDLRGRLLAGRIYQVENRGPDVPDRFGFELVTNQRVPQPPPSVESDTKERKSP